MQFIELTRIERDSFGAFKETPLLVNAGSICTLAPYLKSTRALVTLSTSKTPIVVKEPYSEIKSKLTKI